MYTFVTSQCFPQSTAMCNSTMLTEPRPFYDRLVLIAANVSINLVDCISKQNVIKIIMAQIIAKMTFCSAISVLYITTYILCDMMYSIPGSAERKAISSTYYYRYIYNYTIAAIVQCHAC